MNYEHTSPREVRELIRTGKINYQTSGMCAGYAQANLVILPKEYAYDFLLFAQRNPRSCPLLEVLDEGAKGFHYMADKNANVAMDIPKYRVYRNGVLTEECENVLHLWQKNFVSFLIGCSFSFESELLAADVPVRHIEENRNVPMYNTNIPDEPAGIFCGNMVVSMRPIPHRQVVTAVNVTAAMPKVHGAPIHIGDPAKIGIADLGRPDYGDSVTINEDEVPVFWPCGVTPQAAVMAAKPSLAITHSPGHMFITDVKNISLKY
ncbi:MAG: putative hydro-lyase [Oscillospiraceae bacterium]|nr:putative hydro-lyase [Oscillospiraceae bacterium]